MLLGCAVIQLIEKPNAFAARFAKEFAPVRAGNHQTRLVINPRDLRRCAEQKLELQTPSRSLDRQQLRLKGAEPIGVKIDVARFVLKNQVAHFLKSRIARAKAQESIVCGAHQFRGDEQLNFKFESERVPDESKQGVRPVPPDGSSAETNHEPFEQTRVLVFFRNEKFERAMISGIVRKLSPHLANEECSLAGFAQLKVRERMRQSASHSGIERTRHVPFRFEMIQPILFVITEPLL